MKSMKQLKRPNARLVQFLPQALSQFQLLLLSKQKQSMFSISDSLQSVLSSNHPGGRSAGTPLLKCSHNTVFEKPDLKRAM